MLTASRKTLTWCRFLCSATAVLAAATLAFACAPTTPEPKTGPASDENTPTEVKPTDDSPPAETGGPKDAEIGQLTVDASTEIRVKGIVSQVLGMQLVPPKVVFKVRDNTGEAMAVINEQVSPALTEGQKVELVGHYKVIAAPLHRGGDPVPEEPVFVVDRFLVF